MWGHEEEYQKDIRTIEGIRTVWSIEWSFFLTVFSIIIIVIETQLCLTHTLLWSRKATSSVIFHRNTTTRRCNLNTKSHNPMSHNFFTRQWVSLQRLLCHIGKLQRDVDWRLTGSYSRDTASKSTLPSLSADVVGYKLADFAQARRDGHHIKLISRLSRNFRTWHIPTPLRGSRRSLYSYTTRNCQGVEQASDRIYCRRHISSSIRGLRVLSLMRLMFSLPTGLYGLAAGFWI